MNKKYLEKLEYNKIIDTLENYAKTYIGKEKCKNLVPSKNVSFLLNQTYQAVSLIYKNGTAPVDSIPNVNMPIKSLESNFALIPGDLLNLASILKTSRELKEYLDLSQEGIDLLSQYFENLYINKPLEQEIYDKILDENTIADNASTKLNSIRKSEKNLGVDIKNKLNTIVHSSTYSKYLQDNTVTIKDERYVIPVKEEFRGQIKGFAHGFSSSGSTIFIEPLSVFELNNELNNLKIEEEIEIQKILSELSRKFMPIVEEIKNNIILIGEIDFIFAKASFSKAINGIKPEINDRKIVNLFKAKHPLIDTNKVVPIDITIGEKYNSLVITGPNTGGKTVALKTVGLLLLMAYSGILIPADEKSTIYVFDSIFADIGDEQSISDSLSTFSSHMLNIIDILKNASSKSLILLDELGSGTDPIEGSSLAISILEHFHTLNATTICTTHYQELKEYVLVTEGFENASFEFNLKTLSPTYKLLIGIPGKSNAFEISKRLGLDNKILENAKSRLNSDDVRIEDLLKEIYDNKLEIEKEKEETLKNLNQAQMLRKKLETDFESSKEKAILLVENAKKEARDLLIDAKDEANEIIKEMNTLKKKNNVQDLYDLKSEINEKIKEYIAPIGSESGNLTKEEAIPGLNVYVIPLGKNGVIKSKPNSSLEVEVEVGNLKTNVNINKLVKLTNVPKKDKVVQKSKNINSFKSKTISNEINVIGLTVLDAIPIIDKYLDDANLAKLETVRIVHGKGTGKLKDRNSYFLKKTSTCKII